MRILITPPMGQVHDFKKNENSKFIPAECKIWLIHYYVFPTPTAGIDLFTSIFSSLLARLLR